MTVKHVLIEEAERIYSVTEALFGRVTDGDLSWKPKSGKNWMTVGQLLMHVASFGCGKAVRGFVTGDWGVPGGENVESGGHEQHIPPVELLPGVESVEEARRLLAEDRELALGCLVELEEGHMVETRCSAPWGGSELSLFQHLLRTIAHLSQHKGQLFYYLKLMGRDVSTVDLWGPANLQK